jgi:hypothetical protein
MSEAMEIAEQQKVSIEDIRQVLKELAENRKVADREMRELREAQKETDRIVKENAAAQKESKKEFDRELKKRKQEFDQQVKEYNKRFGDFTNRYGEMIECMVTPNILDKFSEIGFEFDNVYRDVKLRNKKHNLALQIDILLGNGEKSVLVEVKSDLETKDVKKHAERLEKMRLFSDLRGEKITFLGAVAGMVITPEAKEYALTQGFFVLEPSGETFNVIPPNGDPQEW